METPHFELWGAPPVNSERQFTFVCVEVQIPRVSTVMAGLSLEQWMDRKLQHAAEVCERLTLRIVPASKQVRV